MRWLKFFGPIVAFVVFILIFCIAIYFANADDDYIDWYNSIQDGQRRITEERDARRDYYDQKYREDTQRARDTLNQYDSYRHDKEEAERDGRFGNPYYDD